MGRRRAGPGGRRALQGGGARCGGAGGRPREGAGLPPGGAGARPPPGEGQAGRAGGRAHRASGRRPREETGEGPCRRPALPLWLSQARRGRLGVGGGPGPGPAAGRAPRGRRALTAAGGRREAPVPGRWRRAAGRGAVAAGEGALALPRRPLLSVCVCSKMAARLTPRDADAGPRGRPLRPRRGRRHRHCPPLLLRPAPTRTA